MGNGTRIHNGSSPAKTREMNVNRTLMQKPFLVESDKYCHLLYATVILDNFGTHFGEKWSQKRTVPGHLKGVSHLANRNKNERRVQQYDLVQTKVKI